MAPESSTHPKLRGPASTAGPDHAIRRAFQPPSGTGSIVPGGVNFLARFADSWCADSDPRLQPDTAGSD